MSHSSYKAIYEDYVAISGPPVAFQQQLREILVDPIATFPSLFDFLKGKGIQCPQLFEAAKIHFNDVVDLRLIDTDEFRL